MTHKHQIFDRHGNLVDDATIIPDGGRLVVPLQFADSLSRAIASDPAMRRALDAADNQTMVVDATGSTNLSKPGARYLQTPQRGEDHARLAALRVMADEARAEWINDMQTAWSRPSADTEPLPSDDPIHRHDAVPTSPTGDAREEAWREMVNDLQTAWRTE